MDIGLLVLRVALALILGAHSSQKTLGWFHGRGLASMAAWFSDLGLRPGRTMVVVASLTELAAGVSIGFGFLTALGAAAACGAMFVAGLTMHVDARRLWNAGGGGEYPYLLSLVALVLGFTGPGEFSVDAALIRVAPWFAGLDSGSLVGVCVGVVAGLSGIPFAVTILRSRAVTELAKQADRG